MSIYDVFSGGNRPFDKEEWAAAKQAQRKEAYELIQNNDIIKMIYDYNPIMQLAVKF